MAIIKHYHHIDPNEVEQSPEHKKVLITKDPSHYEGTVNSLAKYGRFNPIHYYLSEDNPKKMYVLDGWKAILHARSTGLKSVFACRITRTDGEDLQAIVAQLNRHNHICMDALYKMSAACREVHFRGQGYRSDLKEGELDPPTEDGGTNRRLNLYERIGLDLSLKPTMVKYLLKVGDVNPLHFERIEKSRYTLFAAYHDCVKEEQGHMPEAPPVSAPVYVSSSTQAPQFSEPSATPTPAFNQAPSTSGGSPVAGKSDALSIDDVPLAVIDNTFSHTDYFLVRANCRHCGKETIFKINKNTMQ